MPPADRRYLAEVTESSLAAWKDFCARNDVDRAALCEVIGFRLAELERLPPVVEQWVREARALATERRRRM